MCDQLTSLAGDHVHGALFLPPNIDPTQRYPTLLMVYQGPHVQLVRNWYATTIAGKMQMYASLGYVCVIIDGRGSYRRGLPWEAPLKYKMGTFELQDQIDGIDVLCVNVCVTHYFLTYNVPS